ncbi:MAG: hypothetical protein ABIV47_11635 [Roseiflexaceae bacterium]
MRLSVRLALCLSLASLLLAVAPHSAAAHAKRDTTKQILKRLGRQPCLDSEFTCFTIQVPLARLLYLSLGLDPQSLVAIPDPSYADHRHRQL